MDDRAFERIKKNVALWLKNEAEDNFSQQLLHDEPSEFFDSFNLIKDQDSIALIGMNFEHLSHWHLVQYENALINKSLIHHDHLAYATKYAKAALDSNEALISHGFDKKIDCSVLMTNAALTLSLSIIAGWKENTQKVLNTLLTGLDSPLLDLRINPHHSAGEVYRHFWFLLQLCLNLFSKKITPENYSYPNDMSPYAEVLEQWDTDDLDIVQKFISSMANFHLAHSQSTGHEDILEFDVESRALFPYEILSFLRIREWAGLENPDTYEHPLMNTALALLTDPAAYPPSDFSDRIIENLMKQ